MLTVEQIEEMARDGQYAEPDPDEVLKAELVRQNRDEHFGGDLAGMTDDEAFDAMPKPWRKNG